MAADSSLQETGSPSKTGAPVSASGKEITGEPLKVVDTKEDHTFELNVENLERILLNEKIREKKVVVVSVAGAFRKGKSFLLDFFLRYITSYQDPDWIGGDTSPLKGFPWRGGADRLTTGILMWSEPFSVRLPTGEEVEVLLMDTQGAFDSESTVKDCATVFALSTMLSSVQVYNISGNIQEDDLQHLQLFTEYGRLAMESDGIKPFQKLLFLVRDWPYPYQHEYGTAGGNVILEKRLTISDTQHVEHQQLRRHIKQCFNDISCFLLPHPGLKVATNPQFDGRLSEIEPDFKDQLKELVPILLAPENLVVKEINGNKLTGQDLVQYFKSYMKIYQGNELPEPKSMLRATAEANNLAAKANSRDTYNREMEHICGGDKPYLGPEQLKIEHEKAMEYAIRLFTTTRKMGDAELCKQYEDELRAELLEQYENFEKHNESKNIFAAARTPAVLFAVMVVSYIISGLLLMIGMETLANVMNFVMGTALVCLAGWAYARYSGEFREVGVSIDKVAEVIWEGALGPVCMKIMHGGAKKAIQDAAKKKS